MGKPFSLKVDIHLNGAKEMAKLFHKEGARALVSSLNRTMSMANTAANREVRSIYNLNAADLKYKDGSSKVYVSKATPNRLEAGLTIRGFRLGFYLFAAKYSRLGVLATKQVVSRVTVEIRRGNRFMLQHAFIAPWKRGQEALWVMEADKSKGKTTKRTNRATGKQYMAYPRKALFTVSLPEMYSRKAISGKITQVVKDNFYRIFKHEFTTRVKGIVRSKAS